MKVIRWIFLLGVLGSGCNKVNDIQPNDTEENIPVSAIEAVTGKFPQAKELVFKTLEKNQVWQVNFSQNAARFSAATNQQRLLVAYQVENRSLPDSLTSLVRNTVIDGGTFSNLRLQNYFWYGNATNNGQLILADYDWRGSRYTIRWNVSNVNGRITYVTEMLPYHQLEYRTETLANLPAIIQKSLQDQQADFNYAVVQVGQNTEKRYVLTVRQATNTPTLTYNDEGTLLGVTNLPNTQYYTAIDQLPSAIQTYLRNTSELSGFDVGGQFPLLSKTNYGTIETYTVNLQKGRETWFMTFNSNGELITRSYLNLV
ncbi:hypothetical protein [Spirosoma sp.]|uniref:hypothetical protein n=1 Tax=Spirosoma sp. TaxID=1899569 RepID=UPI003B3B40A0